MVTIELVLFVIIVCSTSYYAYYFSAHVIVYCLLEALTVGLCDVDISPTSRVQRIDEEMVESHD